MFLWPDNSFWKKKGEETFKSKAKPGFFLAQSEKTQMTETK